MSVCELRDTDKKLELERNEKTLTKQEELRKNGRDLPFSLFVWKSAHFVGSLC